MEREQDFVERHFIGRKCIIRTYSAGVWFGDVKELVGTHCVLQNARRLWSWYGAASLSQLAQEGITGKNNKESCKFAMTITDECGIYLPQTIEVIPCTQKAIDSINSIDVWKIS